MAGQLTATTIVAAPRRVRRNARRAAGTLAQAVVVAFGSTFAIFVVMRVIPGDPARILAGPGGAVSDEQVARTRAELGLDQPLLVQYWDWISSAARGDFGDSLVLNDSVATLLGDRLVITLQLAVYSFTLAVLVAVPLAVASARWRGAVAEKVARLVGALGVAVPSFWLAILLIVAFQGILPTYGYTPLTEDPVEHFRMMVLPATALGAVFATLVFETTRAGLIETLQSDYVRTAHAFGISKLRIHSRYALRNALLPTLTIFGLEFGSLIAGALLVENAFAIPGMGRLVVQGVLSRDYPVVQACILVIVVAFVTVNLLTDAINAMVDPRVRRDRA